MTEEEKEKKREREKKKEKKERRAREREVRRKKRQEEEKQKKEKEREMRRIGIETKAFTPREEEDPGELSDAGSIDSLDSQHDYLETHHIDNPMVRLALSAASEIEEGERPLQHLPHTRKTHTPHTHALSQTRTHTNPLSLSLSLSLKQTHTHKPAHPRSA